MSTTTHPHHQALADMRAFHINYPQEALAASEKHDVPLSAICAVLRMETGGGRNVFGHDGVRNPALKGGPVTRDTYRAYVKARDRGLGNQGVGPGQLTASFLQNLADQWGGCWKPAHNISVMTWHLGQLHKAFGSWRLAFQHYNGSGPAAVAYGRSADALMDFFHARFTNGHAGA
jgi:hypothetical protein